jgi:hypothetical protein
MPAETDAFVIATFAMWAGDFVYAEELLRTFASRTSTTSFEHAESPEDILRVSGRRRLHQLWQRRGEFRKLITEYPALREDPLIIVGKHVRGTVWRVSERSFEMYAYLTDLSWERELFARARVEFLKSQPVRSSDEAEQRALEHAPGIAWTTPGNPTMEIDITDLGQIEVRAVWVNRELPESVEQLRQPLAALITRLDE